MAGFQDILNESLPFDPAGDFEQFLKRIPAKWVVYLLADEHRQPVQLLCVKNLRHSLKRRLGGLETIGPTKRVNYRDLIRHIYWRRVDSEFEADWLYYESARLVFPQSYQGMIGFRPAWFIHVNPDATFPRYMKTTDLSSRPGMLIGPVEDKHAAGKLIQWVEDWFDLCRYYNILLEAPHGSACAYKEMGKCPAPCDGSISMPQYQRMIDWSAQTLVDPSEFLRDLSHRMQQAAGDLRFEAAGKIKAFIEQVSQLGKGSFRHVARLENFQYLSLQRGPRSGLAKVFLIMPGRIDEIAGVIDESFHPAEIMRRALTVVAEGPTGITPAAAERIGIVAHHLFSSKPTASLLLSLATVDEKAIAKAYRDLRKQKDAEETEEEGVIKELQAM